jgi:membrane protein required for colicin V production
MVETSMNIFDLGVLIIIGLSALLSFFRGFVREILSLGAWAGATIITLYTFPMASKVIEPHVKSDTIASGIASIGVFFIALILISIVTGLIIKFLKTGNEVGVLDNLVGLAFGVARGVLIVAIAYFVMTIVVVEKDYPAWVKESKSQPYVAKAAHWVAKLTPSYLDAITNKADTTKIEDAVDSAKHRNVLNHKDTSSKGDIDADIPQSTLPSIEDLQQRIREENERNNVR